MTRSVLARLLFVVPLLAAAIALGSPSPAAAAGECANQTLTGTIKTGLVVPAGTTCSLDLADVRGSVTVEAGGILSRPSARSAGRSRRQTLIPF